MWVVSQLCVYATVCWLSFQFIFYEKEFFSDDFNPTSTTALILFIFVRFY